ncbi:MAG: DUF6569 family protein [Solirubrobacteraceae bacterium]
MSTMESTPPRALTLGDHLAAPLRLGEPDVAGPLAVFPLFGPDPRAAYRSFAQARALGAAVKEVGSGADVQNLTIHNPTPDPVLLFEGEEVLGAQQNRTFDHTILVAAGTALTVPVSCVEAGRWDGGRHAESFAPAPEAAHPRLRRLKNESKRLEAAAGRRPSADQGMVWDSVRSVSAELGAASPTGAMSDVFSQRRGDLDRQAAAIRLRPGQIGALVAIGGRLAVLDHVSRPDVFAALHGPLVQGYALDALGAPGAPPPAAGDAAGLVELIAGAAVRPRAGLGLGQDADFDLGSVAGSALLHDGELIQVSAFVGSGPDVTPSAAGRATAGRIRRPSRRRPPA